MALTREELQSVARRLEREDRMDRLNKRLDDFTARPANTQVATAQPVAQTTNDATRVLNAVLEAQGQSRTRFDPLAPLNIGKS